ncbi:MAG TPA: tetratricopeptide repeat protein, partial [Gemmataceae bacterium]|nr:tetratricopeptide repeat protein [Gemmataceae bacterium]
WLEARLVQPVETRDGICYFDFRQVSAVKNLCKLTLGGVSVERIRRSLRQLARWMPDVDDALSQLSALQDSKEVLLRSEEGRLVEPSGQIVFEFEEEPGPPSVEVGHHSRSPEQWFEDGCSHEDAGRLIEAARSYQQALLARGPDPDACFNLANVLYALGRKQAAAERYRQVVEMSPSFAEAWNNLGNVLAELGEPEEAAAAYQRALTINPGLADARYNLADLLEEQRKPLEARPHWQAYIRLEPHGKWADYARSRLLSAGRQKRG